MNTEIALLNENQDHGQLMAQLGFGNTVKEVSGGGDSVQLPRLKIINKPIMGEETSGKAKKPKKVELVSAGAFALQVDKDTTIYANTIKFRTFAQQFMIKRYDNDMKRKLNDGSTVEGGFIHTVMSPDQWTDELCDDQGGVNCGKPSGYIEDFNSLPDDMKQLIRDCKRLRVLFGTVELVDPVDEKGDEVENLGATPCVWEGSKSGFKPMGEPFKVMEQSRRLPLQHNITVTNEEAVNGSVTFFVPVPEVDLSETLPITEDDQVLLGTFMGYITEYNNRVMERHRTVMSDKRPAVTSPPEQSDEDKALVEQFIDVEADD